ncbi:hypothetical protein BDP55DRAFT_758705 [Colletotrichum godetiae]|uniref:Uncharacterized protein n=1 Tax=Colletotrichum godetiae TaxID=1209918 RepID=A0AAJ0A8R4_9PEZI|nr:uncharacterized protein BDP55DRAFT_758705 [Colletotrichum godetiae]KAK1658557.1 hypothetical protein BDP55DRAFT_758705 [Colletotrichum godetiae]
MATFCVTPRCGLCRFKLYDGELIITGEPDSTSCHCFSDLPTVTKAGQSSEAMVYEQLMVDSQTSRYLKCVGDCSQQAGRTTGCHVECVNQTTPWPLMEAIEVLTFRYEPTDHKNDKRKAWLHQKLSAFLDIVLPRLPRELRINIAGMCLRSYAVARAKALGAVPSGESSLQVSSRIWDHFTTFEGKLYLSSLSKRNDDYHGQLMYVPKSTSAVTTIYLREDHFGVRMMSFRDFTPDVGKCRDIWWRTSDLGSSPTLVVQNKGPKLCCLVPKGAKHRTNVLWAIPPSKVPRLIQLERSLEAIRMSAVVCNDPSVIAYSVHWDVRIMSIHAHILKEGLSMYHNRDKGIWLFFPLYRNEKIAEVYIRGTERLDLALIFRTSRGRVLIFGPHLTMELRLDLIDTLPHDSPNPERALSRSIPLPQPTYEIPRSTLQTP